MIRLVLILLLIPFILVYTVFDIVYCFFIKRINKEYVLSHSERVVKCILKMVVFLSGVRLHVTGRENMKLLTDGKAYLVISNHRGYFDIITGYLLFDSHMGIVAKKSMEKIPLISYWMKRINCVFLDRHDLRDGVKMIVDSINNISNGISMWIFPEGTRCTSDDPYELLEFKSGSFKIAEKSGCDILPISFKNTEAAYEKHIPIIKAVDIYINIGKPYNIDGLSDQEKSDIGKYSQDIIKKLLTEG